jgi:dienelactone hydrolase
MNSLSLHTIFTAAALIAMTGIAAAADVTEVKTYQSTISTDAQGALDLKMEVNYDDAVSNAPVMVMTHQYSDSPDLFNHVRPNAQQLRNQGFFVISVAMRGRMSSDGVRDSGGVEIHDIYDAVEAAKTQYGGLINPGNINITGYSGGGGNTMSALTKFPDYFRTGGAFYGMSDYGYDTNNGWYNNGAASNHRAQLEIDVGNPNTPTALITSRYMARASNLAARNNPYSEIHFFVNSDETTCPPINDTSYRNNAIAAASFSGEFNNITLHTGTAGIYQDFNSNSISEANEQQYWPHTTLTPDQQASGQSWYLSRVLDGSIPAPVLNASDNLFVAGFVRTRKFSFFIGDGQNGAGSLLYTLSAGMKTFTFDLQSAHPVTGKLTVDTADMNGQTVNVLRNGVLAATFTGGGIYQVTDVADNETVRLTVAGARTTSAIQMLSGTDKDNTVPWDFRVSAGRNAGVWSTIPVPSCWETKGFGSYEYGNINTSEYGEYKKAFNVPADWADKRVFLVFEGSMTDTEPRINGLAPGGGGTVPAPSPLSNERALDNRASAGMGLSGGIATSASGNLNLGTLSSFTLACWVKPEADFSTLPDGRFPRLMLLGANAGYDGSGDGAYLSIYNSGANTRALQFRVPGVEVISSPNVLSGNDWTFVAVTYDSTLGSNQVKLYVGNRAGALGSPVSTGGSAGESVPFGGSASAYFMNRSSDRSRAFDGLGDDFRIFNSALSQAQLETVRASCLDAAVTPPAPLYHWNLNTASTGTTVTPVTGAGGTLTLQNSAGSATNLYSPIHGGVSSMTLSDERALDNRTATSMGQGGGVAASTSGDLNLGTLTSFTVACWVKPEVDFSSMADNRFPRLMLLGANANYNGDAANGIYLSAYNSGVNTRTLQFKINNDGSNGVLASPNVLSGSDWTFVAATYDSTLGSDHVKLYVGNRTGALAAPVTTATYGSGASVQFGANAYAYLLNRSARDRGFDGLGDDFRIFNSALSQAQLETVRASALGTSTTPPALLYQWNFNNASSGTSVAPVVGTGGVLTLQNSAGTATDLYSSVGDGVSSGTQTVPTAEVHQGGFYEFSYDVTDNLNFGASNLLDVTVKKSIRERNRERCREEGGLLDLRGDLSTGVSGSQADHEYRARRRRCEGRWPNLGSLVSLRRDHPCHRGRAGDGHERRRAWHRVHPGRDRRRDEHRAFRRAAHAAAVVARVS